MERTKALAGDGRRRLETGAGSGRSRGMSEGGHLSRRISREDGGGCWLRLPSETRSTEGASKRNQVHGGRSGQYFDSDLWSGRVRKALKARPVTVKGHEGSSEYQIAATRSLERRTSPNPRIRRREPNAPRRTGKAYGSCLKVTAPGLRTLCKSHQEPRPRRNTL